MRCGFDAWTLLVFDRRTLAGLLIIGLACFSSGMAPAAFAELTVTTAVDGSITVGSADEYRIDVSAIDSPAWRDAIERATNWPPLKAGHGQITLLRVVLSDETTGDSPAAADRVPTVNGVPLYIPGWTPEQFANAQFLGNPEQPARKPETVQLSSIKLVTFDDFPNGGGMYREVPSGSFVMVEHINSTRRQNGRDPLAIGSFTHSSAKLWVPVPPRGQLGILGDVVLSRPALSSLGRIVVEVIADDPSIEVRRCQVGTVVAGGIYGRTFEFHDGLCSTGRIPPGEYKVVLPDFNPAESRWNVTIEPGEVTYLRLVADSPDKVRLVGTRQLSFDADE